MKTVIRILALLMLLGPAISLADGNAAVGKTKAAPCAACHGEDGKGIAPNYPVIAGQHAAYLAHSLRAYRDGDRTNALMAPFAANLTDDDINDLAAWFASLPGLVTPEL